MTTLLTGLKDRDEARRGAFAHMMSDPHFDGGVLVICVGKECPYQPEPTVRQQDRCRRCERVDVSRPGVT